MDEFFARNRLSAYLDGELTAAEAREVEASVAASPELREELDALRGAIALLRAGGPVAAPKGFADRLEDRLVGEPMRVGWRRHFYRVRVEGLMLAAAAALVLVFAARKPAEEVPSDAEAPAEAVPGPAIDVAGLPGVEGPSLAEAPPAADGVLGDEALAGKTPTVTDRVPSASSKAKVPTRTGSAPKSGIEKEPYVPAWEQQAVNDAPPTVQAPASFQFRLQPVGDRGLSDLAALAASLGGTLADARGRPLAPYPMEAGDSRTVKLMLPSVNAGMVAARLTEIGAVEVINVTDRTLYANGATVPVVIEVRQGE